MPSSNESNISPSTTQHSLILGLPYSVLLSAGWSNDYKIPLNIFRLSWVPALSPIDFEALASS